MGDTNWDNRGLRGFDAGSNLKSTIGWYYEGNGTDLYGFNVLPGGLRFFYDKDFLNVGVWGMLWTTKEIYSTEAWYRWFSYGTSGVTRENYSKLEGHSVRCIRDY